MEIPQDVVEAIKAGKKIEAIKRLRETRPMGLKEAKEAVEAWQAEHPEVAPPPRRKASGSLLLTLTVVAAFAWMFVNLVDVAASFIVLAHQGGYAPATFTVETLRYEGDGEGGLMWGFDGKIDDRTERYYAPKLADAGTLGPTGLSRIFPPGTKLEVWYNSEVTATLFQGRTLRVLPYTTDLVAAEVARLNWWVVYCLLPFVLVAIFAARTKKRNRQPDDRNGLPPALGPSSS
jgi:hypothetical protein